jgi:hypothetical protein
MTYHEAAKILKLYQRYLTTSATMDELNLTPTLVAKALDVAMVAIQDAVKGQVDG